MLNIQLETITNSDECPGTVYFDAEFQDLCVEKSRLNGTVNQRILSLLIFGASALWN
ncbi:hypothetical protein Lepto7375DRAFT_6260 [Leptolyngbya sp. PCC 7375]|nr:hypothetical protein Lepto7375DRAFT_6260 [Leptolyngbya sp. PCC 7375]